MNDPLLALLEKNHDKTVFKTLGIAVEKIDGDESILNMAVDDRHKQHLGMVHGGIYVLLAESVVSIAAASSLKNPSDIVVAVEINANHLRKCVGGTLTARSKCLHKGGQTRVYQAEIIDEQGRLLSTARSTLMVISPPDAPKRGSDPT